MVRDGCPAAGMEQILAGCKKMIADVTFITGQAVTPLPNQAEAHLIDSMPRVLLVSMP